ncbi:MAG TPA: DnaJ domain-containing protein [Actinomycetota bacterium]|nr:DnaJ domain-containing protein [Actinomycetota bacterium]
MANRDWIEKDYYAVLGVKRDASEAEIKKAYRALALRNHPDANRGDAGAEERFKGIAQAFEVLSRAPQRSQYDRLRAVASGGAFRPTGFQRYAYGGTAPFKPVRRPPTRGRDLQTRVVLSAKEARKGVTVPVEAYEPGRAARTVIVRVPAGVVDGQTWRIPKRGGYGANGGEPGDLLVTARVFSAQVLKSYPELNDARSNRGQPPMKLRNVPKAARMIAHFLLNPNDVELNEALSRFDDAAMANWAEEIIRSRRSSRR